MIISFQDSSDEIAVGSGLTIERGGQGNAPAIALYTMLGEREAVLHFDIAVIAGRPPNSSADL